jgi:hypothetical protein
VTYEGIVPAFDGLPMIIGTTDTYQTLTLAAPNGLLCTRGVEDFDIGQARVAVEATAEELQAKGGPQLTPSASARTADYIQITDDVLPSDDPYWQSSNDDCWEGDLANADNASGRYNICSQTFGSAEQTPELSVQRDFPILQAYDDHLVVGQYAYPASATPATVNRVVAASFGTTANPSALKLMRCCFHHQVAFHVRTGGEWSAIGSATGFLHHIVADPQTNRCVLSCDPKAAL